MALEAGTRLGSYTILGVLGSGGMGEVYRASDTRLRRTVAIKVLPPALATPERIERFELEARAASALNHPNILTIHDVGRDSGIAYLAMEWVDGQTLRDLLRAGPVPLRRVVSFAGQIADGLARAHAAGIVHRDLKPENVMVTADGLVKIVDFGLAKLQPLPAASGDTDATVTAGGTVPGLVLGTVGYMSPEQASGRPADYRSDQFALGLLLYELLTRTRPFERPTTAQSLAATIEADPPPIETLNPNVPAHLAAIVTRLLSKEPAERYDSTRDLARELKSVTTGSAQQAASPAPAPRHVPRRAALAVVLLGVLAGGGAALWYSRAPAPSRPADADRPLLVVRPFRSLSADNEPGYFAAGITEEIRGQLSQVSALRLLSRNALDSYKDDVTRAVRDLGIRNIVDGSIRVEGTRVRVSAELVDASTQQTLWSNTYDRDLADVLAVQSDIAQHIARALMVNLSPSERARIEKRTTGSPEAYALYLQAQPLSAFNREQTLEAIALLRKAVAIDPDFATARAHIGYRLVFMGYYDDPSSVDGGLAEAEAALRIDPSLAFGYFVVGSAYGMKGMDAQARQAFLRALELDPNHVSAMYNFSIQELNHGRLDEAAYWGRRGFLLSGRTSNAFYHLIIPILNLRADREARRLLDAAERRSPTFARIHLMVSALDLFEGRVDAALARAEATLARHPDNEEVKFYRADLAYLLDAPDLETWLAPLMERSASNHLWVAETVRMRYAYALARRGERSRAAALVDEAERIARQKIDGGSELPALRVEMAAAAAMRNDAKGAAEWLDRALAAGYRDFDFLARDPILRGALGAGALDGVVERMRRDVEAQRERARRRGLLDLEPLLRGVGG